jgi:hypothetical protein
VGVMLGFRDSMMSKSKSWWGGGEFLIGVESGSIYSWCRKVLLTDSQYREMTQTAMLFANQNRLSQNYIWDKCKISY